MGGGGGPILVSGRVAWRDGWGWVGMWWFARWAVQAGWVGVDWYNIYTARKGVLMGGVRNALQLVQTA